MAQLTATRLFFRPARSAAALLFIALAFTFSACTHPNVGCTGIMPPPTSLEVSHGVAYIGILSSVAAVRTGDGSTLWQATVAGGDASFATLAGGVLYVGSGANLTTLRTSDGKQLWQFQGKGSSAWSTGTNPIVSAGVVYVASTTAVYAVRTGSGQLLWQYATGGTAPTMLVLDNAVLYAGSDGSLAALQPGNGKVLWKAQQSLRSFSVLSDQLYIYWDNAVTALRKSDGKQLWRFPVTSAASESTVTPTASGIVYINALDTLYALRGTDGKQLWSFPANGFVKPLIINGRLYTLSDNEHTVALNATTGALIWQSPEEIGQPIGDSSSGAIYTRGVDAKTHAGSSLALRTSNGSALWVSPDVNADARLLANGVVYFAASSGGCGNPIAGDVYALRTDNGSNLWHFHLQT